MDLCPALRDEPVSVPHRNIYDAIPLVMVLADSGGHAMKLVAGRACVLYVGYGTLDHPIAQSEIDGPL